MTQSTISLHPLTRADGSATYIHSSTNTTILCGVNFPVEAPARSSLPEECYIEVNVCPAAGVGQVKERHLETLVADTLRAVVLGEMYPRCILQVTLQVVSDGIKGGQGGSYLPVLAGLVNAAVAGCLDAGVGMRGTVGATLLVITRNNEVKVGWSAAELKAARSMHVLAFSSAGELLLVESEGKFSFEEWEEVEGLGRRACVGNKPGKEGDGVDMEVEGDTKATQDVLRAAVEMRVMADERWRG